MVSMQLSLYTLCRYNTALLYFQALHFQPSILILEAVSRAILVARDEKSFCGKFKWLVIGGAIAIPNQLVARFF